MMERKVGVSAAGSFFGAIVPEIHRQLYVPVAVYAESRDLVDGLMGRQFRGFR